MMACDKGYHEVVSLLLDGGADVSVRSADGYSAYRVAKEGGHEEVQQLLLRWVDRAQREQREKEDSAKAGQAEAQAGPGAEAQPGEAAEPVKVGEGVALNGVVEAHVEAGGVAEQSGGSPASG